LQIFELFDFEDFVSYTLKNNAFKNGKQVKFEIIFYFF
jgi:hypothetical protein